MFRTLGEEGKPPRLARKKERTLQRACNPVSFLRYFLQEQCHYPPISHQSALKYTRPTQEPLKPIKPHHQTPPRKRSVLHLRPRTAAVISDPSNIVKWDNTIYSPPRQNPALLDLAQAHESCSISHPWRSGLACRSYICSTEQIWSHAFIVGVMRKSRVRIPPGMSLSMNCRYGSFIVLTSY